MLWPSRKAPTENSSGIVGTVVGALFGSNAFRPLLKTSFTTAGVQIFGR